MFSGSLSNFLSLSKFFESTSKFLRDYLIFISRLIFSESLHTRFQRFYQSFRDSTKVLEILSKFQRFY